MNAKIIAIVVTVILLLAGIGVGVYLSMNPQDFFPSAQQTQTPATTGGSCPAPGTPGTVTLSYPYCDSVGGAAETCVFERAGCVWESVSGATKYTVKVTEVETGATIATETINAPAVKTSFPVVQGRTYKCEVSAINSCGATGGTNEDTLLCEADAFVSPAPVSTPPPPPPPPPTPAPTPSPLACGIQGCSSSIPCDNGFICIETSVGANYCARSEYQSQCYKTPGEPSCCQAPAPKPTLPPAGALDATLIIGGAGMGLVILGAAALLLL